LRGRHPSLQTSGSSSPSSASTCTSETLVVLDELIDRANPNSTEELMDLCDSPAEREYDLRMLVVSRCVERIGDHAVDIGEQVAYLVTGEFREFSDASHPA
jgi:phosphate transport system protein